MTKSGLLADEPVLVATFVTWLLTQAGIYVVGHTHLVTDQQWSGIASTVAPIVTGVILAAIAWFVRRVVTPVAHLIPPAPRLGA